METRKRRLILARHGETEWNSAFRFQGRTDVPLGERGLAQAELLALRLAKVPLDRIYSSPLARAHKTASVVAGMNENTGEVTAIEEFSEMSFGRWEGLRIDEVQEIYPVLYSSWRDDPSSTVPPGGESFSDLVSRVGRGLQEILSRDGDTLLVVCHGGTIRAALSFLAGIPSTSAWKFRMDNCSISAVDLTPDRTTLRYVNDALHTRVERDLAVRLPLL